MKLNPTDLKPRSTAEIVINSFHIALAVILVLMSFLVHGRVPGLSADSSAALGFIFFFGLGLPLVLLAFGTVIASILSDGKWPGVLSAVFITTIVLVVFNVWTGIIASLGYLSLSIWVIIKGRQK